MTATELPDRDNVVRHVGGSKLRVDGTVDGEAFRLSATESGLSVNWIEFFGTSDRAVALDEIRRQIHRRLGTNSVFAELNVQALKALLNAAGLHPSIVHDPLPSNAQYGEDQSHSEVLGLPPHHSPDAAMIGDMIADLVAAQYPAVVPSSSR